MRKSVLWHTNYDTRESQSNERRWYVLGTEDMCDDVSVHVTLLIHFRTREVVEIHLLKRKN
jgi:hypothetical protein